MIVIGRPLLAVRSKTRRMVWVVEPTGQFTRWGSNVAAERDNPHVGAAVGVGAGVGVAAGVAVGAGVGDAVATVWDPVGEEGAESDEQAPISATRAISPSLPGVLVGVSVMRAVQRIPCARPV